MALPGRRKGLVGLFQDVMDVTRSSSASKSSDSSTPSSQPKSHYDQRAAEKEKNQRKYEDAMRKGYIDIDECERIDKE